MEEPLHNYPDEFLVCREQHAWPLGERSDHWREDPQGWRRVFMCNRCHAIATDTLDRSGRMKRWVKYPTGYAMPKGKAVSRRDVRLQRVQRVKASI